MVKRQFARESDNGSLIILFLVARGKTEKKNFSRLVASPDMGRRVFHHQDVVPGKVRKISDHSLVRFLPCAKICGAPNRMRMVFGNDCTDCLVRPITCEVSRAAIR